LWEEWQASERFLGTADEMWTALWRTVDLFRALASGIALDLGISYPADLDAKMMSYLRGLQRRPRAQ
jgi:hypothetical protein